METLQLSLKPNFTHECKACIFLGTMEKDGNPIDLYICDNENQSLLYRFGNEGPEYASMQFDMYLTHNVYNDVFDEVINRVRALNML